MHKILFFLCVVLAQSVFAQTIRISGKITDKQGKGIDFATITVCDSLGKVLTGVTSDSTGHFRLPTVPDKAYRLNVKCIGYQNYSGLVKSTNAFTAIRLEKSTINLKEVTVTKKKPVIQREIDRLIFNAERINTIATNFLDVLQRMPGVIVQEDGISLIGKKNILFLMNGRELHMDMKGLMAYLRSMPADDLKQIELMTVPPARFSAEGDAGVINFVTKKIRNNYVGGTANNKLAYRKHLYDDAGISLQYKRNRIETYLNAAWGTGYADYDNKGTIKYPSEEWQTSNNKKKSNKSAVAIFGLDYALNKNATIGTIMGYTYLDPGSDNTSTTSIFSNDTHLLTQSYETLTNRKSNYNRYRANVHYQLNNIHKKGTLELNADYLYYHINDRVNLETTTEGGLEYLNYPKIRIKMYQLKADMEMPFAKGSVSYGGSFLQATTDNWTEYKRINREWDLNDHFIYKEQIGALYTDFFYKISSKWGVKAGVRGEYSRLDGNSIKLNQETVKHLFDVFPTAYVSYKPNDNNSFTLRMSSRINRPDYYSINPFSVYSDENTVTKGNPDLKPTRIYVAEMGYTHGNFSTALSYRANLHEIHSYVSFDKNTKLATWTEANNMNVRMYELSMYYVFDKLDWLESDIDGNLYILASKPMSGFKLEPVSITSCYLYINNNIYLNRQKTLMANVWAQYQSKEKDVTGEYPGRFRMDAGIKWLLFKKKLAIGLEYRNLVASHSKTIYNTENAVYTYDSTPFRAVYLNLSYRFGKKLNMQKRSFGIDSNRL